MASSHFFSRCHGQERGHEGLSLGFLLLMANGIEILVEGSVCNDVPQVEEGKIITAFVTTLRDILKPGTIEPGNSGGHRRKLMWLTTAYASRGWILLLLCLMVNFVLTGQNLHYLFFEYSGR